MTMIRIHHVPEDRPTRRELLDLVASREPVRSGPSSTELIDTARNAS